MRQGYNRADVESWLELARGDWEFIRKSLGSGFNRQICFLCQQAAEKAIKGLIYSLQDDFSLEEIKQLREHDLEKLTRFAGTRGAVIPETVKDSCLVLRKYYIATRYPDAPEPVKAYTKKMVQETVKGAKEILDWVERDLDLIKFER